MKLQPETLKNFLEKVTLNGFIEDSILKFSDEGITISVKDASTAVVTIGIFKASNLKDYKKLPDLPIKNNSLLIKLLGSFDGEVTLEKEGNKFKIFNDKKEADMILANESFITSTLEKELKLEYSGSFKIKSKIFKSAIKNMSILGAESVEIEIKDKNFNLRVGKDGFDKISETEKVNYGDTTLLIGNLFPKLVDQMGEDVEISLKTDYPATFMETTDKWKITSIIAPIQTTEE